MTYVVGIDPSSKLLAFVGGWASDTETITRAALYTLGGEKYSSKKLRVAKAQTLDFLATLPLTAGLAIIEDPLVGVGGPRATIVQAYINAVVTLTLLEAGWEVLPVNVQTWKKDVVGNGAANKSAVVQYLRATRRTAYDALGSLAGLSAGAESQDLADALAIQQWGTRVVNSR